MELRQLRAFAEVVELGTFRAAAAKLHLTQPALWQQVRSLQDELGVRLFERSGRRVRVTRAGVELLDRAQATLTAAERLHELARAMREGNDGVVTLASPAPPIQLVLAGSIGELSRTHPHIRLELHDTTASGKSPLDALGSGEVDLAVAPREESLEGFRLLRANVVVVAPPGHALARRKRIDVERLRGVPLLTPPLGSLSRGLLERACSAAGFAPLIRLASASPGALVALAKNGFGVAVLASDALIGTRVRAPAVVTTPEGVLHTEAWLHWRRGAELSPAARQFVDCVRRNLP